MIKSQLLYILIISSTFLPNGLIAQTGYTIIDQLYKESDVILQGKIEYISCWQNEVGVAECEYTLSIDSIFKGSPRVYNLSLLEVKSLSNQPGITLADLDSTVGVTYFMRQCPWFLTMDVHKIEHIKDNCYSVGDSIIVFLNDIMPKRYIEGFPNDTIYPYHLIDQWASVYYPSSYLALYLRKLSISR